MAATILLTGATGYVGSRLLRVLEEGGVPVRCLARQPVRVAVSRATTAVVAATASTKRRSTAAMHGVDQAYYLVHSMAGGGRIRGARSAGGGQLRTRRGPGRRAPHRLSRRARRRPRVAVDAPQEPRRNRAGVARVRRADRRVPRVDRHRRRQPLVRDDSRAGRAAARDDLSALGGHADPADRHRRRAGVSARGARPADRSAKACSRSAVPRWSPTAT